MADANWVKELRHTITVMRAKADYLNFLADAFHVTGNLNIAKDLRRTAQNLSDEADNADQSLSTAARELYETAEAGAYATIQTALVICDLDTQREKE